MTCGDLGEEPESFDLKLHETFMRGINWGAIILLDEVEEYVYRRTRHTMKRNYLTPILLRHLQTSESLTIITMTQIDDTDEAFMGRIQLPWRLPDISFEYQQQLWRKAIGSIRDLNHSGELHGFIENGLKSFEGGIFTRMNARQIINAVRLATAIARGDRPDSLVCNLCAGDIRATLTLGKEFTGYMQQEAADVQADKTGWLKLGGSQMLASGESRQPTGS